MSEPKTRVEAVSPSGQAAAVEALYREHHRTLVAFLQCRLGTLADAQEVAQEAYVRMLTLEQPDKVDSPRAFLFRIAANLAMDRLRLRKSREPLAGEELDEEALEPLPDLHLAPVPERLAVVGEEWRALQAALRELPAKTSQAFVLHMIEGRDFELIAQTMKLSARMVRYHVTRALEHCRSRVTEPGRP